MTLRTAHDIWGEEVVRLALDEPEPDPVTDELAAEMQRYADRPGFLRSWALAQPWPKFCAIVHIVSGEFRREVLGGDGDDEG